jgi:hypothetical protein
VRYGQKILEFNACVAIERRSAKNALRNLHCYKSMAEAFRTAE